MFVLVQGAAEAVVFSDVEPDDLVGIGQRCGQWVQWSGVAEALVGPVVVVEVLELAQRVHEVDLVPDQGSVE